MDASELAVLTIIGIFLWYISNVIYSIYFSPLKDIPSPLIFQFFPLYLDYRFAVGNSAQLLHQHHLQRGKVFRVGWRRVVFVDP